jgi:DNA-binding NarL/FixJ family response regulator
MIRILIADDHPVVRRGLKQTLAEESDLRVLGDAANGQEVLQFLAKQNWDVLILDLNMPGRNGLEILREVKERWPKLPVLVLSMHCEEQFGIQAIKAGAAGYLTKESAPDELVQAVRKVHGGGKYISPALAEHLASAVQAGEGRPPHEALTAREYDVLLRIAKGKTVTEIANELALSVKTVSTYRTRTLEKMNLSTNAELILYALRNRLVE